jgi:hypothetical protein
MRRGEWEPSRSALDSLLGQSPLSAVLACYMDESYSLDNLTVLARGNDPGHCGRSQERGWLCGTLESLGVQISEGGQTIRNRGLHYLQRRDPAPGREADHGLPRGRGDGGGLVPAAAGRAG